MDPPKRDPIQLSVILPVFNEAGTVAEVVRRVQALPLSLEVLAVDDGSDDGTHEVLQELAGERVRVLRHAENRGKGAAIRTALPEARGRYVVIQDGDLEYDPDDILALVREAEEHDAPVVYGNRVHGRVRKSYQRYYWGGRVVTLFTNLLYRTTIHDEPVCYKLFRRELLQSLPLECTGFEFCPEVTARVAGRGIPIREVQVSYNPRSFAEGKKITWQVGLKAIWVLLKLRLRGADR